MVKSVILLTILFSISSVSGENYEIYNRNTIPNLSSPKKSLQSSSIPTDQQIISTSLSFLPFKQALLFSSSSSSSKISSPSTSTTAALRWKKFLGKFKKGEKINPKDDELFNPKKSGKKAQKQKPKKNNNKTKKQSHDETVGEVEEEDHQENPSTTSSTSSSTPTTPSPIVPISKETKRIHFQDTLIKTIQTIFTLLTLYGMRLFNKTIDKTNPDHLFYLRLLFSAYLLLGHFYYYLMRFLIQQRYKYQEEKEIEMVYSKEEIAEEEAKQHPLGNLMELLNGGGGGFGGGLLGGGFGGTRGGGGGGGGLSSLPSLLKTAQKFLSAGQKRKSQDTIKNYDLKQNSQLYNSLTKDLLWIFMMTIFGSRSYGFYYWTIINGLKSRFFYSPLFFIYVLRFTAKGLLKRPFKSSLQLMLEGFEIKPVVTEDPVVSVPIQAQQQKKKTVLEIEKEQQEEELDEDSYETIASVEIKEEVKKIVNDKEEIEKETEEEETKEVKPIFHKSPKEGGGDQKPKERNEQQQETISIEAKVTQEEDTVKPPPPPSDLPTMNAEELSRLKKEYQEAVKNYLHEVENEEEKLIEEEFLGESDTTTNDLQESERALKKLNELIGGGQESYSDKTERDDENEDDEGIDEDEDEDDLPINQLDDDDNDVLNENKKKNNQKEVYDHLDEEMDTLLGSLDNEFGSEDRT